MTVQLTSDLPIGDYKCNSCQHQNQKVNGHSSCRNEGATVVFNSHAYFNQWANWPIDFDPIWLISCNGYKEDERGKRLIVSNTP
jgi:hypothetical protein